MGQNRGDWSTTETRLSFNLPLKSVVTFQPLSVKKPKEKKQHVSRHVMTLCRGLVFLHNKKRKNQATFNSLS
jgi:hypothetical protein